MGNRKRFIGIAVLADGQDFSSLHPSADLPNRIQVWFNAKYHVKVHASANAKNEIEVSLAGGSAMAARKSFIRRSVRQLDGQEFSVNYRDKRNLQHVRFISLRFIRAKSPKAASRLLASMPQRADVNVGHGNTNRISPQATENKVESKLIRSLRSRIRRLQDSNRIYKSKLALSNTKLAKAERESRLVLETMFQQSIDKHQLPLSSTALKKPKSNTKRGKLSSVRPVRAMRPRGPLRQRSQRLLAVKSRSLGVKGTNVAPMGSKQMNSACESDDVQVLEQFLPIGGAWQDYACKKLGVGKMTENACVRHLPSIGLGSPIKVAKTRGDGNCFFRAISFATTGVQSYHSDIRRSLTTWMEQNAAFLASIIDDMPAYLRKSKMRILGIWATQYEISALATMLQTKIHVCFHEDGAFCWNLFLPLAVLNDAVGSAMDAIYLDGGNGHYDLVLDVQPLDN